MAPAILTRRGKAHVRPKSRRKSAARLSTSADGVNRRLRTRLSKPSFPDLDSILGSFSDAIALVEVSLVAVSNNEHSGPERVVLRLGVEAMKRAYNELDKALVQLAKTSEGLSAS